MLNRYSFTPTNKNKGVHHIMTHSLQADDRVEALTLAVQFHGMANHSQLAKPAGADTVLKTADVFAAYIAEGVHLPVTPRSP